MKKRVLFICVHNSARSQMAEAWLNHTCGEYFEAQSAGLEPGTLNPFAVQVMAEAGIDISNKATQAVFDVFKSGQLVLAMVYTLGDISGAHINPAVTIGFWAARRFDADKVLPYIVSQCVGAFLASAILRLLFPVNITLGATIPAGPQFQSFILELILTALLMFVILVVSTGARAKGITAGIAVGSVIGLEAMFAGPICGASMNPARSLAPAVVSLHLQSLWVYLLAPTIGALGGVLACRCVREPGCC